MLELGKPAPEFEFENHKGERYKFPGDFSGKWLGLFFLRHLGCPLCKEKISELKENQARYQAEGVELFVLVESTPRRVQEYGKKEGIDFHLISDREKRIYQLYQVSRGSFGDFFSPSVLSASLRATFKGHFHGRFEGDEFQRPACFIVAPSGKLVYSKYGKNIAKIITEEEFFEVLKMLKEKEGKNE